MTNETAEAVAIDKPSPKGGRPKGYNPLMPLSTTPALVKATDDIAAKALSELQKLGEVLGAKRQTVDDLLALLVKSEAVTQSLFAAASVRWLQRGMLLTELRESFIQAPEPNMNWMEFYRVKVQPITNTAERSEQQCRTLWRRWLQCNEEGIDAQPLLAENLGVVAMNDALGSLLNGSSDTASDAAETAKRPKVATPVDRIRKAGRKLVKDVVDTRATANDPHLRSLLERLNEVLSALDEYYGAVEGLPVIQAAVADTAPADDAKDGVDALEDAIGVALEVAAG